MSDTDAGVMKHSETLAEFEGPDTYWSIDVIHNPENDTFKVWVVTEDGPKECICKGVGRWFSYGKDWEDYSVNKGDGHE